MLFLAHQSYCYNMNTEEINQEVIKWIKEGLEKKSILRKLDKQGVSPEQAHDAYEEARLVFDAAFRKKNMIVSAAILVVLILCALVLIPITSTGKSPYLYGILLGLIIGLVVLQFIESFHSFQDFIDGFSSEATGRKIYTHPILFIGFPIVFSIALIVFYHWEVRHEIDRYGVVTEAEVMDGYSQTNTTTRTSTTTNKILVMFRLADSTIVEEHVSVTSDQFDNAYIGQEIQVRYSSRHPEFFNVIIPDPKSEETILKELLQH